MRSRQITQQYTYNHASSIIYKKKKLLWRNIFNYIEIHQLLIHQLLKIVGILLSCCNGMFGLQIIGDKLNS